MYINKVKHNYGLDKKVVEPIFPIDKIKPINEIKKDGYDELGKKYISKGKVALFLYTQSLIDKDGVYHNTLHQDNNGAPFFDTILGKIKRIEAKGLLISL